MENELNNNLLLVSNTEGKFVCIYISKQYKGDSLALLQRKYNISKNVHNGNLIT